MRRFPLRLPQGAAERGRHLDKHLRDSRALRRESAVAPTMTKTSDRFVRRPVPTQGRWSRLAALVLGGSALLVSFAVSHTDYRFLHPAASLRLLAAAAAAGSIGLCVAVVRLGARQNRGAWAIAALVSIATVAESLIAAYSLYVWYTTGGPGGPIR